MPCLREVLGSHLILQVGVGFRCAQSNLRDSKDWSGMMDIRRKIGALMVVDCACKGRWREWGKMAHLFAIRQGKMPCLREVLGFHLIMQAGVGFRCAQSNLRDSKDWSGRMDIRRKIGALMVVDCACKGRWREWGKMAHVFAIRQGKMPCLREVSGSLSIVISKMESSFIVHQWLWDLY